MRTAILTAGFLACLAIYSDANHAELVSSAAVSAIKKSETTVAQTETVVEEIIEETVETNTWQEYFITSFSSWHSAEKKSVELKEVVSKCFSESVNGYTYWEKITKNQQYVEFLAAATGFQGNCKDIKKVNEHCVEIAASKPRLLALAFKSISKNFKNSNEKLVVAKLAKTKYHIGEKVIEVKKDWKQFAISNFLNWKSIEGKSSELIKKVTTVLQYDSSYFDKFIKKKIYAEYLAHATGYKGEIKKCEELKKYLIETAKSKPRLVALAIKYLAKNLKNPKVELTISPTAIKKFGIKEKTCKKVDWKSHLIKEYYEYKSTEKYKEADQRLRVKSMLNYEADSGTILDYILKRKQYKEFFAKSIGYEYNESSFVETDFREYVKKTSELYPTLVSLSFRSICKNLKSNQKLVIAKSAEKIIKEKFVKKSSSEKKLTKKTTKTTTTTTTTKTWEEYVINEFAAYNSQSGDSSEIKTKVENFLSHSTNGYSCLEKILKRQSYAEYLAYSTGYKGDYKNNQELVEFIKQVAQKKPRLLASSLKYVTKNIENSSEKLVVSKTATKELNIQQKTFEAKLDWKKYVVKEFADWKSESRDSGELKTKVLTLLKYDESYWNKVLSNTKYLEYLKVSTGYKGSSTEIEAFKEHFSSICKNQPRLAALSIKNLAKHFKNSKETLKVSKLAKTKYNIQETEISKTDWTSYAIKTFTNFVSDKSKSHFIKARLKKLIDLDADGSKYLDKIVKRRVYAEYLSRATGFTGDWRKPERIGNYIRSIIESRPRLVACAFKYIAKNHQDSNSKLVISEVAKKRFNIGSNSWAGYAIANFADFKTAEDKSHLIRTRLQKLVDLKSENQTYLERILQKTEYAEYIAKSTGFTGDCKNTNELKEYIYKAIKEKPRLVACSLKYIAFNQADSKASLKISKVAKNRFKIGETITTTESKTKTEETQVKSSSQTESSSTTVKKQSSSSSITETTSGYLKNFINVQSASDEKSKIVSSISEFARGNYLEEILEDSTYVKYLAATLEYSEDYNKDKDAFKVYIRKTILKDRPLALALSLKKIYYHLCEGKELVIPRYVSTKYQITETEYQVSSSSSSSTSYESYTTESTVDSG